LPFPIAVLAVVYEAGIGNCHCCLFQVLFLLTRPFAVFGKLKLTRSFMKSPFELTSCVGVPCNESQNAYCTLELLLCRIFCWPSWLTRSPSSWPPAPPRSLPCSPKPSRTSSTCVHSSRQPSATSSGSSPAPAQGGAPPGMWSWGRDHGVTARCLCLDPQHCCPLLVESTWQLRWIRSMVMLLQVTFPQT